MSSTATAPVPNRPEPPLPPGWVTLPRALVRVSRAHASKELMADSARASLKGGEVLLRAIALWRALSRILGPETHVGLLLPPMVPPAVANLALSLGGRIPVNLNYTAGPEAVDSAIRQCGIRHVVTSERFLEKVPFRPSAELITLESIPPRVTKVDKLLAFVGAKFLPIPALAAICPGLRSTDSQAPATVIFTSGSTGDPKGVVLSHANILSNVMAVEHQLEFDPDDSILGITPFFHSMGFTISLWMTQLLAKKVVFHYSPLDARIIGDLCERHGLTVIVATPTFMRAYIQKCGKEKFAKLKYLVLGAEKLKPELERDIREAIGVAPLEGYGCTETAPVVAVNTPREVRLADGRTLYGNRPGTVGLPVVGTSIKTIDPDTGEDLPPGAEGLVCVKGPQIMLGYLNKPEETAKVLRDGWYNTGDLGYLDPDGFLKITDRLNRFSKVGGEMVPHVKVESALMAAAGCTEQEVAVTGLPDDRKGERLFVLYTSPDFDPGAVVAKLREAGLPNLWIPSERDFARVEALPVLGTGKIDIRGLKNLARERAAGTAAGA